MPEIGVNDGNESKLTVAQLLARLDWALLIIGTMLTISMIKIMAWQQVQKMEILREIKRLEMRVMLVADRSNAEE